MDHHPAWTWLSPPLPVMQILVLFFGRRLSKVHLGYLSLILEKEPIKCQEYEFWVFFSCCYRAVNLKTEMPGDPSTEKPSGCRSRQPGSPGILFLEIFLIADLQTKPNTILRNDTTLVRVLTVQFSHFPVLQQPLFIDIQCFLSFNSP